MTQSTPRRPEQVSAALAKLQSKASLTDDELQALQSHIDSLESRALAGGTHHHDLHSAED